MGTTVSPAQPGDQRWTSTDLLSETFAARYLPRVHRFAVMVSPPGVDPDDLTQQAMLRAFQAADQFDPRRGTLDSWLWRIVVNLARDAGRMSGRTRTLIDRLALQSTPPAPASPEDLVLDHIRDDELLAAVRRLPRRHRSLIALRYGAGLSAVEAAELLGTTRMAVTKATARALHALRCDLTATERQ